jgi:cation transport regulator ChaB
MMRQMALDQLVRCLADHNFRQAVQEFQKVRSRELEAKAAEELRHTPARVEEASKFAWQAVRASKGGYLE